MTHEQKYNKLNARFNLEIATIFKNGQIPLFHLEVSVCLMKNLMR